jgi:hypothetical protein
MNILTSAWLPSASTTKKIYVQACLRAGFGVPIAPMTSGAQPCMPAAPCGPEDARTSLRTIAGLVSAISLRDEASDREAEEIDLAELQPRGPAFGTAPGQLPAASSSALARASTASTTAYSAESMEYAAIDTMAAA